MLEVLPIEDKILQESLCLRCGVKFNLELMAYGAYSDGKPAGVCQFTVKNDIGVLADLSTTSEINKDDALFALGLAVLNFMDFCGAHEAKCEAKTADEQLLYSLGFSSADNGEYIIKL